MTAFTYRQRASGFTLIELSIVLVVIGLIVGGVLVGRDLIKAAGLRSQMTQVEQLNTAVMTFKGKYDCLPGDCSNATTFFGAASQPTKVTNGNGNGMIEAGDPGNFMAIGWNGGCGLGECEWQSVFDHLGAAGLWKMPQYDETNVSNERPGYAYPSCSYAPEGGYPGDTASSPGAFDCGMIVFWWKTGHFIRLGAAPTDDGSGGPGYLSFYTGLTPAVAQAVDVKFDDGVPLGGAIQIGPISPYQVKTDGSGLDNQQLGGYHHCATAGAAYDLTVTNRVCSMRIKAVF